MLTNEQARTNQKAGAPGSLSASSAWHLRGLETFWELLKSPNLLTSLYHRIYRCTCRSGGDPSLPSRVSLRAMTLRSRPREQRAQYGEGRQQGWNQEGGFKRKQWPYLSSAALTATWKMGLRSWRRVWEESTIEQNKINGKMRQIFPLGEKKILVQKNGKRLHGSLMNNIYVVKTM